MENNFYNWTKTYKVKLSDEILEFVIAAHLAGYYTGIIIHFEKNKLRKNPSSEPAYSMITEYFGSLNEEGAYKQCIAWIENKFKKEYKIIDNGIRKFSQS